MSEMIRFTSEEIEKALRCCVDREMPCKDNCPYNSILKDNGVETGCHDRLLLDAADELQLQRAEIHASNAKMIKTFAERMRIEILKRVDRIRMLMTEYDDRELPKLFAGKMTAFHVVNTLLGLIEEDLLYEYGE